MPYLVTDEMALRANPGLFDNSQVVLTDNPEWHFLERGDGGEVKHHSIQLDPYLIGGYICWVGCKHIGAHRIIATNGKLLKPPIDAKAKYPYSVVSNSTHNRPRPPRPAQP